MSNKANKTNDESPSERASNGVGNDPKTGRFLPGNKAGKGNPLSRQRSEADRLWLELIDDAKRRAFIENVYERAMDGDRVCIQIVEERVFGKLAQKLEAQIDTPTKTYIGILDDKV